MWIYEQWRDTYQQQVFTNCVHSYDCTRNVYANGVTSTQKSCTLLIPLCKNNLNMPIPHTNHYALRK